MKKQKHKLLTASILVSLTSATIFLANKITTASAVVHGLLHSHSANFYNWKFGKIHYTVKGKGSPLLLIHDLTPCSGTVEWKALTDSLSQKHTVYCIDLLGCGCSDRPKITYTNFLYVQLITDFIKNVIKEKTDVVTSGLSGSFAAMACRYDESVINRIMMINPEDLAVLNQIPTKQSKAAKFLLELPLIGTLVYNIIMSRTNIDLTFTEEYLYSPFHMDTELVDSFFESAHLNQCNGKYLLASMKGKYIYCNIAPAIKTLNNSIYIIHGKSEKRADENAALYSALNPSIECEMISHAKHFPHIETPKKILEAIDIFFA